MLVDGGGAGVDVRFGDEGHAEGAFGEVTCGKGGGEARLHLVVEERLEFFGRAGKEDDDLADWLVVGVRYCRVEILAGGAAVLVVEDDRAVEDVGLLGVVGWHDHLAGGEAFVEGGEDGVVGVDVDAERGGDGLAGEVVFGGAEAAGEDDDVGAGDGDDGGAGEVGEVVADDGLEGDLDAEVVEAFGEVEGVGVLAEGREHLGARGDDFSDHVWWWLLRWLEWPASR